MAKRLFVGGIPYATQEQALMDLFSKVGKVVSCKIITDKYTGRSKGFGFVEFESDDDAKKAIDTYNGYDMDGRKITVNEARPMVNRDAAPAASPTPEPTDDTATASSSAPDDKTEGEDEATEEKASKK